MRFRSLARVCAVAIVGLFVANRVYGQSFEAVLEPGNEVPPHNTPAYGYADFTLNVGASTISINAGTGTYNDLLGGATRVSLNDAPAGSNGATIATFTLDTPGQISGTYEGSITTLTMPQMNDIIAGNTYLNIADSIYPSGEIRGQLEVAPEPASLALVGGAGVMMMRRRSRT